MNAGENEDHPELSTALTDAAASDESARFDRMTLKELLRAMNLEGVDLTRDQRPTPDIDL